jgi:long-chain acyl-CoA synthetase
MSRPNHALIAVEQQLLAPGAPFELEEGVVRGERMAVMKHRPPHLRAVLERSAEFPSVEYLVFEGEGRAFRCTYEEHLRRVAALARRLREDYGVQKGDRVALLGANAPEWVMGFWAAQALGAIAVAFNAWWAGDEIRWALSHTEPKLLLADDKRLARLEGRAPGVPCLSFQAMAPLLEPADHALPSESLSREDPAIILFTSGTSGRPRGVVHTHENVCSALMLGFFHGARVQALHPPGPSDGPNVVLVTSPLFHVSGLHAGAISALAGGVKTVWPMGRFDAASVASLIAREKVTSWGYTPTLLKRLVESEAAMKADLSSLRVIGGGGAPVGPELQARVRALLPHVRETFSIGYGLTEGTAFGTLNPAEEWEHDREGVGRPLPTIQIEIRGEDGEPLPPEQIGEIHIRSPLVMAGYFRDGEATERAIRPGLWLRTGDLGFMRDGRLYLASRRTDLILRGGENVYPAEIERRLEAHEDVLEAGVIGVPDDELGQRVMAVVVPREGKSLTPEALSRWVSEGLAYYKVPAEWEIRRDRLPRNATGKVVRHALLSAKNPFIED